MNGGYETLAPREAGPFFTVKAAMRNAGEHAGGWTVAVPARGQPHPRRGRVRQARLDAARRRDRPGAAPRGARAAAVPGREARAGARAAARGGRGPAGPGLAPGVGRRLLAAGARRRRRHSGDRRYSPAACWRAVAVATRAEPRGQPPLGLATVEGHGDGPAHAAAKRTADPRHPRRADLRARPGDHDGLDLPARPGRGLLGLLDRHRPADRRRGAHRAVAAARRRLVVGSAAHAAGQPAAVHPRRHAGARRSRSRVLGFVDSIAAAAIVVARLLRRPTSSPTSPTARCTRTSSTTRSPGARRAARRSSAALGTFLALVGGGLLISISEPLPFVAAARHRRPASLGAFCVAGVRHRRRERPRPRGGASARSCARVADLVRGTARAAGLPGGQRALGAGAGGAEDVRRALRDQDARPLAGGLVAGHRRRPRPSCSSGALVSGQARRQPRPRARDARCARRLRRRPARPVRQHGRRGSWRSPRRWWPSAAG